VREELGLTNVEVMVPFVRTVGEAQDVVRLLAENGLGRGERGLRLIMMCEVPSNAILAEAFLEHFDGFSIGSNDLTQLTLGVDRDSGLIAESFDERDAAVKALLELVDPRVPQARQVRRHLWAGTFDHPDLARWLMERASTAFR
jgi:pyruvate,water dikinase